jgi:excisionase family DNA binding protein
MSDTPLPDPLLTIDQAAREANVSTMTLRRAFRNGHLHVRRFGVDGRGLRILRSALTAWMDAGGRTDEKPSVAAAVRAVVRR